MNEVSGDQYNDGIGVRYNCFHLASNMKYAKVTQQISSYCMNEPSWKFYIETDSSLQTFSFSDLVKLNITSDDLYLWSTPIDTIEQYQIYLETKNFSLSKWIFHNCTLPRFGPMCQYELYSYHENYSSLYELIHDYYENYNDPMENITCYTHIQCHRGYSPACLDWTEICDGKADCLDGNFDEEHCWQLEFHECESNEYVCDIGQCIPNEFVQDDAKIHDCVDRSDEKTTDNKEFPSEFHYEPAFGFDDIRCDMAFLSRSCFFFRQYLIAESMFSVKDVSVSNECWSAFRCYFGSPISQNPNGLNDIYGKCMPQIIKTCPDMFFFPNIPTFFGYIYIGYKKNDTPNNKNYLLPHLCSNKSFHYGSLALVVDGSINNTTCFRITRFEDQFSNFNPGLLFRYLLPMTDLYYQLTQTEPIINFPFNRCNESNIYQCQNSSKCISIDRLADNTPDCPSKDDETILEDRNSQLFAQIQHNYYKCYFTDKYISRVVIHNGQCDCGINEYGFCEDESTFFNFTRRNLFFQTTCDRFQEIHWITVDGKNETDETECEQWECDNIYTRCDGITNCLHGEDEIGCDLSSLFNCSSNERICVTRHTSQFSCLPIYKINDGKVDCLGGTDETSICSSAYATYKGDDFFCMNNQTPICLPNSKLCDERKDCFDGDDEQFCFRNRTVSPQKSICANFDSGFISHIEKYLCLATKFREKARFKQFTIEGFQQSTENEVTNAVSGTQIRLLDKPRCYRGLDVRVWLNKSSNSYASACLCPPSYYGERCQYQNQRVSLAMRFVVPTQLRQIQFAALVMLIDDTNERIVHSFEQFTYLSIRDCQLKFNLYLLYSTRPKRPNRTYSIHVDIYEKLSLTYRTSFLYPIKFSFLPVHRLAFRVKIPSDSHDDQQHERCSKKKCLHGKCSIYSNIEETFCQCEVGWSGQYCHIPFHCTCSVLNSICVGLSSHNRSICICRENHFGPQCYLRNRICDISPCDNNGLCIPYDDFMLPSIKQKYFCICPRGFSGDRCEVIDTQLNFIFEKDIYLSHSIFIHFLKILSSMKPNKAPEISPSRSTALQTISQTTNSIDIYWSQPFHLVFIETLEKNYYLTAVQPIFNYSRTIVKRIDSSHRCPSINELVNETFAQLHVLRRIKSYHSICRQYSPHLQCFHDDLHFCLCYDHQQKRLANCFQFDYQMKFDCYGQNDCINDGQCFQDSPDCPKRSICVCRSCYYGNRCQFSTSEFGLSLDAILAYHIIPDVNIFHQTSIIKISFSLTILFLVVGLINGILTLITFKNESVLEVGCGIYLLGSSITTILATIFFGLKYFIYLSTQISAPSNRLFMQIQCYSLDFLLRVCLNTDQWLNACVSMERAITIIQGVQFVKKKSRQLAKRIMMILFVFVLLTSIHDPIHRRLFEEENDNENKKRIWCIVNYSSNLQIYNRFVNSLLFFVPFLINLISSIILITKKYHQQSNLKKSGSYKSTLYQQILNHKHLLTAPVVLFLLALPRLILSYVSKCMNSSRGSWIFLCGYFISFIPPTITFMIFVIPSEFYRGEYQKCITQYRKKLQKHIRRAL
ncbi:unnamed protein product [Adineta ricciae]|uniref:Uncharacterized protein n=1 Tax=Adineta ricciae TaxID=249248 RepID=A0A814T3A2_ADIRI|nr:unnamed protein product [Adineta ricciae]CAF1182719.1 unnamed protein product [Adineta ricciae]